MSQYSFGERLRAGSTAEALLDMFFRQWFEVEVVDGKLQAQGVDRLFRGQPLDDALAVEYKADHMADRTGNAFVETVSVDSEGKPGWLWTTKADALVYYVHTDGGGYGYVIDPAAMRRRGYKWTRRYPVKTVSNREYHTYGVLVPLDKLERLAEGDFDLQEGRLDGFIGRN